jgi:acyl-coenzyme A thioesterase PaaI-like protein
VIEGLALAAFSIIRDLTQEPLAKAINTYVMQDEARHVAFGRLALRDYYPQLTDAERAEREEFLVEACYLMRDRFLGEEAWERLGFDVAECVSYVEQSEIMSEFRKMRVLQFQDLDPDVLSAQDEELARKLDTSRGLTEEGEAAVRRAGVDPMRAFEVEHTIRLGAEDYDHCFGCGREHPAGLHLVMEGAGSEASSRVRGWFLVTEHHQGAPGLAHGGVISAAVDEGMGFLLWLLATPAVTAHLEVTFRRPVPVGSRLELEGGVDRLEGRKIYTSMTGTIDGEVMFEASAMYLRVAMEHFQPYLDRAGMKVERPYNP